MTITFVLTLGKGSTTAELCRPFPLGSRTRGTTEVPDLAGTTLQNPRENRLAEPSWKSRCKALGGIHVQKRSGEAVSESTPSGELVSNTLGGAVVGEAPRVAARPEEVGDIRRGEAKA